MIARYQVDATSSNGTGWNRPTPMSFERPYNSKLYGMAVTNDVVFSMLMNSLPVGGMMTRMAWGSTVRRMVMAHDMPSATEASVCPSGTELIPALMISTLTSAVITATGGVLIGPLGGWRPLNVTTISLLACAAVFVLVGYQFLIMAVRTGDISFIAPFRYTGLLWAIALGYAIFGDIPDSMMITGSVIVVASGLYTLYREHRASRLKPATNAIGTATEEAGV